MAHGKERAWSPTWEAIDPHVYTTMQTNMYCIILPAFPEIASPLAAPRLIQIMDANNRRTTRFQLDISAAIPDSSVRAGLSTLLFRVESPPGEYSYFWVVGNVAN